MTELVLAKRAADWTRLKALVLDSVSSPITRRVYNLGLDEFIAWFSQEPRPRLNKADGQRLARRPRRPRTRRDFNQRAPHGNR